MKLGFGVNISNNPIIPDISSLENMLEVWDCDDNNIVQDIPPAVERLIGIKRDHNYEQSIFLQQPILNKLALNNRNTITFDTAFAQNMANEPDPPVANLKTLIMLMKLNSHVASEHIAGKPAPSATRWQIMTTANAGEIAIRVASADLVNTVTPGIGSWFVIQAMFDNDNFCRMQINDDAIVTTTQAGRNQSAQRIGGVSASSNDMDLAKQGYYIGDVFADGVNEFIYKSLKAQFAL